MPRKKRAGRAVRNNRQATSTEPEELKNAPHSFVIHRGVVGGYVKELIRDFRKVMEPYTSSSLQVRRKNTIKDFLSVAGLLHVSHLVMFTRTQLSTYLKIAHFPRGPTLTFQIHKYSLSRDVISSLKRQYVFEKMFANSPLVVLNGFSGEEEEMKLMVAVFQNMFPSINLSKVNLNCIRRCVLLNYNPASKVIDFRHYAIKVVPKGVSKSVKKIVQSNIPNLSRFTDMAEYFTAVLSESEAEDDPNSHVTLPQKVASRGNMVAGQSAIRVIELGPRLSLQLIKVEDSLLSGEIVFHELVKKTEEEKLLIKKRRTQKKVMKMKRKKFQEENLKRNVLEKEEHKQKSLKGMKKLETDILMKRAANEVDKAQEEDDDAEWYRQEVGQEPDEGTFRRGSSGKPFKRKKDLPPWMKNKKQKLANDTDRNKVLGSVSPKFRKSKRTVSSGSKKRRKL